MLGYSTYVRDTDEILVMGLESAKDGQGRLAVIFFQALTGSDFLRRIETWHKDFAWIQFDPWYTSEKDPKKHTFIAAPKPPDIVLAAYGKRVSDPLHKASLRALFPCLIEGYPVPRHFVDAVVRRVSNRVAFKGGTDKDSESWEKCLGIACALYKGTHKEEEYTMALEQNRKSRDYLYGRLLAVADALEATALNMGEKNRPTNASRMMQAFASKPFVTWRNLETALTPYKMVLKRNPGKYAYYTKMLEEITTAFEPDDFTSNKPLNGEYLLGYYCQRQFIFTPKEGKQNEEDTQQ
jgi:CRISPR-associated protein Csd1